MTTERPSPAEARVIAGIDEAGLGPLLGPLTIGWSILSVPTADADPWKLLRGTVHKKPSAKAKLVVADSKRVFSSRSELGMRRLEATVLTFMALLDADGKPPATPEALLFGALRPRPSLIAEHPWYTTLPKLPRVLARDSIELTAAMLRRRMDTRGLTLLDAGVRLVPAGELNASYDVTQNKGTTVWSRTCEVLRHIWTSHGEAGPDVTVDILGGRIRYGALLREGFPDGDVKVLFEGPEHSAYRIDEKAETAEERWLPSRMRIDFRAKGEDVSFAVALASCIAKYSRELVMSGFNAYFGALQSGLAPTAGYTTDGRRWLAEAEPALRSAALEERFLIRSR